MPIKKIFQKKFIIFLIVFLVFYIKGLIFIDPDFGWRIRAGEYYWKNGIPGTDIFSYTMPNFPWVDHAWGISLAFYLVNIFLGYPVLVFFMSLLVLFIVFVLSIYIRKYNFGNLKDGHKPYFVGSKHINDRLFEFVFNNKFSLSLFPFILIISLFLPFFGVRAQIFSWFMFSTLIYWLSSEEIYTKVKVFLPVFFLLWANLHGSFALGLFILFFYLALKSYKQRKIFSKDILIGLISFSIVFLNPYGGGVWREAWSSASDPKLRWSIAEWMPALTMFDLSMVFLICISIVLIWRYKRKFSIYELGLFSFLFVQAISSRRQLPFWAIFTFPLIVRGIFYFWNDLAKIKQGRTRFLKVYNVALIISVFMFFYQTLFSIRSSYSMSFAKFYPVNAVGYLKENLPDGEILSEYGWGGYLIWQLPQKKVFIDGRMPSWRWSVDDNGDLASAFDTYNKMLEGDEDYNEIFDRFHISAVLTRRVYDSNKNPFYEKAENFLKLFGWEENDFDIVRTLEENGWKKVYEDDIAAIYLKN